MQSINIAKSIKLSLDVNTGSNIIQLTDDNHLLDLGPQQRILSRNKFLKNLKAYASVNSVPEVSMPDFLLEDSETEKLNKVLDVEWGANRKQLNLLIGTTDSDWMNVGETSLLNPAGYPYRIYNLLDLITDNLAFEMGDNIALAVQIENVGYGLLANNDKVNIYGSYIEELVIDDSPQEIRNTNEYIIFAEARSKIGLAANPNRKYVLIQNTSSNRVYVSLSDNNQATGISLKPNGHYEFSIQNVPYYGDISVFSDYDSSVLLMECS